MMVDWRRDNRRIVDGPGTEIAQTLGFLPFKNLIYQGFPSVVPTGVGVFLSDLTQAVKSIKSSPRVWE